MSGVDKFKARLGANISESMGGSMGGVGGPLPTPAHGVPSRYDGVTRPKDVLTVPIAKLVPDSEQPRSEFDDDELQRLAESLRSRGQLQPIRVRWDAIRELWVIVSGERRWRAAGLAGLAALACVEVKGELTPESILEDQLVENCLRSDLKPIEEARAFGPSWTAEGTRLANSPSRLLSHTPLSTERLPYSTFRPTFKRTWNMVFWHLPQQQKSPSSPILLSSQKSPRPPLLGG